MSKPVPPKLKCLWCDHSDANRYRLRKHCLHSHPDRHQYDIEYHILRSRNPNLDIDLLILKYLDRKENILSLQKQDIYAKHFLRNIGVMRHPRNDSSLGRVLAWLKANDEQRFDQNLRCRLTRYHNMGVTNMDDIITTIKLIKYTQKQLAKAKEPIKEPEPEERLYK